MIRLEGTKVRLRALEPSDLELLYRWENDPRVWEVSDTLVPYSRETLRRLIEDQRHDIFRTRQLRLVILRAKDGEPVGFIDLFDFDPVNLRAAVGILIFEERDRGKGYASDALGVLADYSRRVLGLHQLYCSVHADNTPSLNLFRSRGFVETGRRREWSRSGGGWRDELFLQLVFI